MMAEENTNSESDVLELNKNQNQKKQEDQPEENKKEIDFDDVIANQNPAAHVKSYDPNKAQGYDMERWTRYFGSIADAKTEIQTTLAQYDSFKIIYNKSNDYLEPQWDLLEVKYHSVTTKALEERQKYMAEVEDLTRASQAQTIKMNELQQVIRERQAQRFGRPAGRAGLENMSIEELQRNLNTIEEIDNEISRKIQEARNKANWIGFQMYFHIRNKEVFDNCRADHLDDILKACDHRQGGLPKNPGTSKNLPIQERVGVS